MLNRDWSQLPQELLSEIYSHLNTNIEHLYFRSVCQSWWFSALQTPSLTPILHLPNIPHREIYQCFLTTQVIDDDGNDDDDDHEDGGGGHVVGEVEEEQCVCSIVAYSLVESNIHVLHSSSFSSKNPYYKAWLFKVHETRRNVFRFLNPLSRTPINVSPFMFSDELNTLNTKSRISGVFKGYHLEREEQDSDSLITKAVRVLDCFILKRVLLSPTSTIEDYVIMAMHPCGILIVFKSGDKKWTVLNAGTRHAVHDVIHYKGQFYAVDSAGGTCVVYPHTLALTQLVEPLSDGGDGRKHLIKSNGELFLINVFLNDDDCSGSVGDWSSWKRLLKALACDFDSSSLQNINFYGLRIGSVPVKFAVYKLDERKQEWAGVNSLGDRIFFVGERSSFSISDSEILLGCKGNCILFADFSLKNDLDVMRYGAESKPSTYVFNLEDNSIRTLADYPSYSRLFWPPPDFDCAAKLKLT